jgi:hypothetical protein
MKSKIADNILEETPQKLIDKVRAQTNSFIRSHIFPFFIIDLSWEWDMFGAGIIVFRNSEVVDYKYSLDIQILWLNAYMQFIKK